MQGIDYQGTFAPVSKLESFKSCYYSLPNLGWPLHHYLDIQKVFLNGDLEEIMYMEFPHGF